MSSTKQKADDLIEEFTFLDSDISMSIECAIIAVEYVMRHERQYHTVLSPAYDDLEELLDELNSRSNG